MPHPRLGPEMGRFHGGVLLPVDSNGFPDGTEIWSRHSPWGVGLRGCWKVVQIPAGRLYAPAYCAVSIPERRQCSGRG